MFFTYSPHLPKKEKNEKEKNYNGLYSNHDDELTWISCGMLNLRLYIGTLNEID